ncbi:SpoIIE family protein phosphatase [Streptomyces sp. NPDC087440]|uniref:PP2C family protein-serine/threonine phosphatase n=1 Tax=Streptomyces sp. NPDC087440 TaxID=3365790 RepID=UPI0038021870
MTDFPHGRPHDPAHGAQPFHAQVSPAQAGPAQASPAQASPAQASPAQPFHALPPLRQEVRRLARAHGLPLETTARLVLSASALAAETVRAGRAVTLCATSVTSVTSVLSEAAQEPLPSLGVPGAAPVPRPGGLAGPSSPYLRIVLGDLVPGPAVQHLALPPSDVTPDPDSGSHSVTWLLARGTPAAPTGTEPLSDAEAYEAELRAVLARVDSLAEEHRLLQEELAETNGGVVALYVQLEERDAQVRSAHGRTLLELEENLRPPVPRVPGVDLAVHYAPSDPAAPTGGDFYDWFTLPDGTLHITVVDALGHGVRSTRSALTVTHAVRTLALEGYPLESLLARADRQLTPFAPGLQATVLLVRLDPATGALRIANGSHPPALLLRADDDSARYLSVRGRGVGYPLPGSEAIRHETLAPGDLLVLYTDGLTESRRDPIEGEERLVASARRRAGLPLAEIPAAIAADMHSVVLHSDDTLALAVRLR